MDHYGIGVALSGGMEIYFTGARATGRTTSLVESVKDGDRVIFADSREAERVRQLCLERGVNIEVCVIDPKTPERVFEREPAKGRTIFDHTWVEKYYFAVIMRAGRDLDRLERETSGYGATHRETRRRAKEICRWTPYYTPPKGE